MIEKYSALPKRIVADIETELADGLKKGEAFDIAYRSANFDEDKINA